MTLTEAEKIARYDAERSGELYVKPASGPELPPEVASGEMSMLQYLARWIDRHLDAAPIEPDERADDDLTAVLEDIERIFEIEDAPAIEISRLYHDPDENGDLTTEPRGELSWTDYAIGEGDARAIVSFNAEGLYPPQVYLFGRDELDLDVVERTLANLQALLSDPRVQALRARE